MPPADSWFWPIISAAFAAGGAYMATRVELRFIWRDLNALAARVLRLEARGTPRRRWNDSEPDK